MSQIKLSPWAYNMTELAFNLVVSIFIRHTSQYTDLTLYHKQTFSVKMHVQRSCLCCPMNISNHTVYLYEANLTSVCSFRCAVPAAILCVGDAFLSLVLCVWTINENITCSKQVVGVIWEGRWHWVHYFGLQLKVLNKRQFKMEIAHIWSSGLWEK